MVRPTLIAACGVLAAVVLGPAEVLAREFRVNQVPNGSQFGCALCHLSSSGGGLRNGFGAQVEATLVGDPKSTAPVDWSAIYDQDGDSDGYSNGRELGDVDGTWTIGQANPAGEAYAPFDRNDSPCGDGVMENPPEECDTDELPADVTCESLGWGPGTLSCSSRCRVNAEACEGYTVVIPNNSNPPANNSNPPTNNQTDAATTGSTTQSDAGSGATEEEGGCATAGGGGAPWGLIVFVLALGRRRRQRGLLPGVTINTAA